jgi:vacuolar-type H+-ATPase subunit E/Vma4
VSLTTILAAIERSSTDEIEQLQIETQAQVQRLLTDAEREAAIRRKQIRDDIVQPVSAQRARRLHRAHLDALRIQAGARDALMAQTLALSKERLADLRRDAQYPAVLRRLIEEAVHLLGENGSQTGRVVLASDARDEALVRTIARDLDLDVAIEPTLDGWGGIVLRSADGRIRVTNTLESRLEHAMPLLYRELGTFFEDLGNTHRDV